MRSLRAVELLDLWEKGLGCTPLQQATLLLGVACSDGVPQDPKMLSVGERDRLLIQLRSWMFGRQFNNLSDCPKCFTRVEWTTDIKQFETTQTDNSAETFTLQASNYSIKFRLPNSVDLSRASNDPKLLLTGCIIHAEKDSVVLAANELPDDVLEKVDNEMSEHDQFADVRIRLTCPECSHEWESVFDIVPYLWKEIDTWAKRMLEDIFTLASAFGWTESQILELSPTRRRLYMQMAVR